jgi:hypothetical protein
LPSLIVTLNRNTIEQFKKICAEQEKKYSIAFCEIMKECLDNFPAYEAEIKSKNIQGSRSSKRNCHKNTYDTMSLRNIPEEIVNALDKIVLATKNVATRSAVVDYILSDRLARDELNKNNNNHSDHSAISLSEEEALALHYLNTNSSQH